MTAITWTPHEMWMNAANADIDDDTPLYDELLAETTAKAPTVKTRKTAKR